MILPIFFIILSILGTGNALDVVVNDDSHATGAVILVVDGLGASYVYPEYRAYSIDGARLDKALLFNLTGDGARVLDMRVPVPETLQSHSTLVTGDSNADPENLGPTIFDLARENGYLCLAILQRGDTKEILLRQDGVLYFEDNSIGGPEPTMGTRDNLSRDLIQGLALWKSKFQDYSRRKGQQAYADYDRWGLDAATDLVERLGSQRFILFMNIGAVDSAGQDLGEEGYISTIQALDTPLGRLANACRKDNVLLMVTADHGMSFPSAGKSRGGHAADKYSSRLESLRIPMVVFGPGVDNISLGGLWSQEGIAPTLLALLGISENFTTSSIEIPLKNSYNLLVRGSNSEVAVYKGADLIANASGVEILFKGLARGIYAVKSGSINMQICLNGDQTLNLAERDAPDGWLPQDLHSIVGMALILAINLTGVAFIIRIVRES